MSSDQVFSVQEAAAVLGVTSQRVRQLLGTGQLEGRRSSAGWLVPKAAVDRRMPNVATGRSVAPRTVWAAIALLAAAAGEPAQVVADRRLRHRVLRMLARMQLTTEDARAWPRLMAQRGTSHRMWAHPGVRDRLATDGLVCVGGDAALASSLKGLSGGAGLLNLYVRSGDADALIRRYMLRDDPDGLVTIVAVPLSVPSELAPIAGHPVSAPAALADLLDEGDVRAHAAALRHLNSLLDAVHDAGWLGPDALRPQVVGNKRGNAATS